MCTKYSVLCTEFRGSGSYRIDCQLAVFGCLGKVARIVLPNTRRYRLSTFHSAGPGVIFVISLRHATLRILQHVIRLEPPRKDRRFARLYQMTLFLARSPSLSFPSSCLFLVLLLFIPSRVPDGGIRPFILCCVLSLFSHFLPTERRYTPRSEVASHTTTST